MNSKGLAISGVIYTILVIMLVMMSMMLFNLQNRKTILDTLKTDSVDAVEKINNIDYLLERIQTLEKNAYSLEKLYPKGSIYITLDNRNPGEYLGGTWEKYSGGRTLVGDNGTSYKAGDVGGSSTVKLLTSYLPSHTHSIQVLSGATSSNGSHYHSIPALSVSSWSASHTHEENGQLWANQPATNTSSGSHIAIPSGGQSYWGTVTSVGGGARAAMYSGYTTITVSGQKTTATNTGSSTHSHTISTAASTTEETGGGEAFSVQNPYTVVYMWQRTA